MAGGEQWLLSRADCLLIVPVSRKFCAFELYGNRLGPGPLAGSTSQQEAVDRLGGLMLRATSPAVRVSSMSQACPRPLPQAITIHHCAQDRSAASTEPSCPTKIERNTRLTATPCRARPATADARPALPPGPGARLRSRSAPLTSPAYCPDGGGQQSTTAKTAEAATAQAGDMTGSFACCRHRRGDFAMSWRPTPRRERLAR